MPTHLITDETDEMAAAAAKSLQSCPTLCNPIDDSPLGSPIPGILQARVLEWVAIAFYGKKSKRTVIDGEIYHVHGLKESI